MLVAGADSALAQVVFADTTVAAAVATGGGKLASGSAWRDFDGDGLPDLFVGNHYRMPVLFRNLGDGRFANVTRERMIKPVVVGNGTWGDQHGSAWADIDNDGDQDLIVLVGAEEGQGEGPKQLFVNAAGTLADHALELGVEYRLARGRAPTWLDFDNDGRLDLFIGAVARPDGQAPPTLFRQTPDGFVDAREATGFRPLGTLGIWLADLDRDGRPEILFRGSAQSPAAARPSRIRVLATTALPFRDVTPIAFRGLYPDLAIADFDGDLRPDLFVANAWSRTAAPYGHDLYLNTAAGWVQATATAGINAIARSTRPGAVAADFDNDMDVDIYLDGGYSGGEDLANLMLWNRGDGTFEAADEAGGAPGRLAGQADTVTTADYDVDGFVDLYLTYHGAGTQLYRNLGNGNHWLQIDLRGSRSTADAIGAQVYVTAGERTQLREQVGGTHRYWGQSDQRLHFGLGIHPIAARVVVDWPSGARSEWIDVAADQVLTITEPE